MIFPSMFVRAFANTSVPGTAATNSIGGMAPQLVL